IYFTIEGTSGPPEEIPPYVDGMDPDDGEVQVPLDSTIVFHCKDDDSGVDVTTIDFIAQDSSLTGGRALGIGSPNRVIDGNLDIDDEDINDVVCTFTPTDEFYEADTITCTVDGDLADMKGNLLGDDWVWTFYTYDPEFAVEETTWGAIKAGI
ncbi:Ig-like domain-containing protein, partial [bacterium]|nr:Ig-like domain-containing protein [bacterium]